MRPRRPVDHAGRRPGGSLPLEQRRADPRSARPGPHSRAGAQRRRAGRAGAAPGPARADRAVDRASLRPGIPRPTPRNRGPLKIFTENTMNHEVQQQLQERETRNLRAEFADVPLIRTGLALDLAIRPSTWRVL